MSDAPEHTWDVTDVENVAKACEFVDGVLSIDLDGWDLEAVVVKFDGRTATIGAA